MSADPLRFASPEALMAAVADAIASSLNEGLAERGAACTALSGGSTPERAYALLAQKPLDWPRITFALVDERFAPPTHEASNERMLRRALAPALAQGARLAPMYSPAPSLEVAADRADALYAPLTFDIALMGMGADGHTASWFDGAEGLDEALSETTTRTVVGLRAPQAAGSAERLSLSFNAIMRAKHCVLAITGGEKQDRLNRVRQSSSAGPTHWLFRHPVLQIFVAD